MIRKIKELLSERKRLKEYDRLNDILTTLKKLSEYDKPIKILVVEPRGKSYIEHLWLSTDNGSVVKPLIPYIEAEIQKLDEE